MADKKSILEEALLDIKKIQEALNTNTKEILRSVAKEEIDSVVKESLIKEDDFEEEDMESNDSTDLDLDAVETGAETGAEELGEPESIELGEPENIEGSEVAPEMEPELGMDASALGGEEMDMTAASDDDVIAIYKKLSGEDEIEIVGDEIHLNISEPGEYVVKTNDTAPIGGGEDMASEIPTDLVPVDGSEEEGEEASGVDYEIELGDDAETEEEPVAIDEYGDEHAISTADALKGTKEPIEELIATNTLAVNRAGGDLTDIAGPGAKAAKAAQNESVNAKKLVSEATTKYNTLLTESTKLKAENEEFRQALKKFRTMLVETVVFNSNLSYVAKLFMEHSTTKAEKKSIMEKFDNEVSNLKESKKLYQSIAKELTSRKPIAESIENKLIKEVTTGASKQLNESTAYVDPSTQRIIDLMKRVDNKNNNN